MFVVGSWVCHRATNLRIGLSSGYELVGVDQGCEPRTFIHLSPIKSIPIVSIRVLNPEFWSSGGVGTIEYRQDLGSKRGPSSTGLSKSPIRSHIGLRRGT